MGDEHPFAIIICQAGVAGMNSASLLIKKLIRNWRHEANQLRAAMIDDGPNKFVSGRVSGLELCASNLEQLLNEIRPGCVRECVRDVLEK